MPHPQDDSPYKAELEIQKILSALQSDIRTVSHKAGNTAQSVDNLVRVIHTDNDSLVNRITVLSQSFIALKDERSSIYKEIEECDVRLKKVEVATHDLSRDFASRQKFNNMVHAAIIAFLVPALLTGIFMAVNSVVTEKPAIVREQ